MHLVLWRDTALHWPYDKQLSLKSKKILLSSFTTDVWKKYTTYQNYHFLLILNCSLKMVKEIQDGEFSNANSVSLAESDGTDQWIRMQSHNPPTISSTLENLPLPGADRLNVTLCSSQSTELYNKENSTEKKNLSSIATVFKSSLRCLCCG